MSVHDVMFLMLAFIVLTVLSVLAGAIGFGIAKWEGALTPAAVARGFIAFGATFTIGISTFAVIIAALK
ncbi:hypothetical protein [Streptomyces sp. NPDC101234]|uniref:hypothetical protein n=1 Tax=Streptomyces sp. NPDC101234 TaxID=3366138 RepID=UPI0037FE4E4B